MTIDVATGISRILKEEGVGWVSTFPVCRVNNALGREGVPMLMMRDDRYAVAVADAFSRITAGSQGGSRIGMCTFQGGVNAAGMHGAYTSRFLTHDCSDRPSLLPFREPTISKRRLSTVSTENGSSGLIRSRGRDRCID